MFTLNRTSGIEITSLDPDYESIVSNLTRHIRQWNNSVVKMELFLKKTDNKILIPRYYPISKTRTVNDMTNEGIDIDIECNMVPKNVRQEKAINYLCDNRKGVLRLEPGSGKEQPIDSDVLSPDGFVKMGDIGIGNIVYDEDGSETKVIGVFPQGEKPIYKIKFDDNSEVECGEDHLWKVKSVSSEDSEWEILTTKDLMSRQLNTSRFFEGDDRTYNNTYSIPVTKPIMFKKKQLQIDPYTLGVLIGGWCLRKPIAPDLEAMGNIKNSLNYLDIHDKHIPKDYLQSDISDRTSLLQGIMDTYGAISRSGVLSFTTTSIKLINDFIFLVRSLGGITTKIHGAYTVELSVPLTIKPFNLNEKLEIYTRGKTIPPNRIIKNIERAGNKQCRCIMVESDKHTYITDNFIVTHNTSIAIAAISKIKKKAIIFAHKDKLLENWRSEIHKFTNLKEEDVLRISTSNYKDSAHTAKILLATPQTFVYALSDRSSIRDDFINTLNLSGIGILVVDECHIGVGPEKFTQASLSINSYRTFGLSATPTRSDGNGDIITYHLGDTHYIEPEKDELLKPNVYIIHFDFGIYSKYKKYISWGGFNQGRYYKQMFKVDKYIDGVSGLIKTSVEKNRKTLVLGNRTTALLSLAESTNLPKEKIGMFVPSIKSEDALKVSDTSDLDESFHTKDVVFSTYSMCRDGNNRVDLDCLIMATTTKNIEQAVGRILRQMDGKKTPIVLDLVDTGGPHGYFTRLRDNRIKEYERLGWNYETRNL